MSEYKKDFAGWIPQKEKLNNRTRAPFVKEREIWWMSIGVNVGNEIDGKNDLYERPVLVYKKIGNEKFIGLPITSQNRTGTFFVRISYDDRNGTVLLADVRTFSTLRMRRKMTVLEISQFNNVAYGLKVLLGHLY